KYADNNIALKIGFEQTISQPSLVYKMTMELDPDKQSKVLEIGTGSGYQTVLLAEFSDSVYTVERIPELSQKAKERIAEMGYSNVFFRIGDGSDGWLEHAPYDRIIVTAAARSIPEPLADQLQQGGRMIIPVGRKGLQKLTLITKHNNNQLKIEYLEDVMFVEFKGKYGWKAGELH
ncbi:MAG TPA: protein-L-isoaspartate(D-aspartate) O-methyltransferase, partial [Clostridia bacterium]|nr:protein-L-isoaspartate(D-aspartate) O-methyltransferase [Clostridia bacterium]